MDSFINESLLRKNIELLSLYAGEEKSKLNQIFDKFSYCQKCYNTSNNSRIVTKQNILKENISTIENNRKEYSAVIEKTIDIYNKTADEVKQSAKKAGGDIRVN